jgi:hypothetical protein
VSVDTVTAISFFWRVYNMLLNFYSWTHKSSLTPSILVICLHSAHLYYKLKNKKYHIVRTVRKYNNP